MGSVGILAVRGSEEGFIAQKASDGKPYFDSSENDRSAVGELGCRRNPAQDEGWVAANEKTEVTVGSFAASVLTGQASLEHLSFTCDFMGGLPTR